MQQPSHANIENELPGSILEKRWAPWLQANYLVIGILGVAILLRIAGIQYGLADQTIASEKNIIDPILQTLQSGKLTVEMYGFSPLVMWINMAIVVVTYALGSVLGWINPSAAISDPANLPVYYLWGRIFNLALAIMSIWVAYRLAKALYGRLAGLITMLLITLLPMHVGLSNFINTEIPATLLGLSALYMMAQLQKEQKIKYLIYTGILCGLALATQLWIGIVVIGFLGLGAASLLHPAYQNLKGKIWIGWLSFLATYLVVNPALLLNLPQFMAGIAKTAADLSLISGLATDWAGRLSAVLFNQVGVLLCLAILTGLVRAFYRPNPVSITLFCVIVVYSVAVFQYADNIPGLLLPAVCFSLVLAAGTMERLLSWAAESRDTLLLQFTSAVVILLAAELLVHSGISAISLNQPSTDALAQNYIQMYVPRFYKVALEEGAPALPGFNSPLYETALGSNHPFQWYIDNKYALLILVGDKASEYNALQNERVQIFDQSLAQSGTLMQEFDPSFLRQGPQIRIYRILPVMITGQELYSDDLTGGLSSSWKVIDGKWSVNQGRLMGNGGVLPQNLIGDLVDADGNGVPDGWQVLQNLGVQLVNQEMTLQANQSNQYLLTPKIPLAVDDPNTPAAYSLSLEWSGQIASPSFYIEYANYDSSGTRLGNGNKVVDQFGVGNFDWRAKSYTITKANLPAGTQSIQFMFLAWDGNTNPQMTVKLRKISFMPVQTNHMALLANQDALQWDKYSYQADLAIDSPTGQAGISFYQQDEKNYYLLVLDKDKKTARLVVVQNNSPWVLAEKPFDPGSGTNKVDVNLTAAGSLVVTINQQRLFLLHDTSFTAGTIGLWVGPGTRAYFGNTAVRYGGQ